jgi:hypothetical protein
MHRGSGAGRAAAAQQPTGRLAEELSPPAETVEMRSYGLIPGIVPGSAGGEPIIG